MRHAYMVTTPFVARLMTGIKSGLRAARHEFVYGIYDGWTGLVRLPVRGARDGGVRGFVTGVGMGVTGFVEMCCSVWAVAYTLKGVVKQAERGRQPVKYIRRARIMQGQREVGLWERGIRNARLKGAAKGWEIMRSLWVALDLEEKKRWPEGSSECEIGASEASALCLRA